MIKDPQDVVQYQFDWTTFLLTGETVVAHTIFVEYGDVVINSNSLAGSVINFELLGGAEGSTSRVTAHIVTSTGREADRSLDLYITQPVDYHRVAMAIVRRITGNRWTWPPMQVRDLYDVPPGTRFLQLRGEPVLTVVQVTDYATSEPIEFTRMGSNRIELSAVGCATRRRVDVVYNYGNKPSGLVTHAVQVLAAEMQKADADDDSCRIPERVTSVTRQGVSWTLIDPMDFIDRGRTGIVEVDMAINAATTKGKARPRVWSPEFPVPDRLSAVQLDFAQIPVPVPDVLLDSMPPIDGQLEGQNFIQLDTGEVFEWVD